MGRRMGILNRDTGDCGRNGGEAVYIHGRGQREDEIDSLYRDQTPIDPAPQGRGVGGRQNPSVKKTVG